METEKDIKTDSPTESSNDDEKLPIIAPLKVIKHQTITKKFGWWSAVVLLESWGRKQLCFYLWQKKGDKWARKQKFAVHNKEDWTSISKYAADLVKDLS